MGGYCQEKAYSRCDRCGKWFDGEKMVRLANELICVWCLDEEEQERLDAPQEVKK